MSLSLAAHSVSVKNVRQDTIKKKEPDAWKGSKASLGLVINTGNTNSSSISAEVDADYTKDRMQNITQITAQFGRSNGVLDKEKYYLQNQLNYNFNKTRTRFIFLNTNGTVDQFSPYTYQAVGSTGYGQDIFRNKRFIISGQIGPGFRSTKISNTKTTDNNIIAAAKINLLWQILKSATLTETVSCDYGQPFNYLKSVTAFTNQISGHLALQVSLTIENYSKIPPNSTNTQTTDTTTNVALVYNT